MTILSIFYFSLILTIAQQNVSAFGASGKVAAFKEINEKLSEIWPQTAQDLSENHIKQLQSYSRYSALKSTESRWLLNEILATLMTMPKADLNDCESAAKSIYRLKETLSETIGDKEVKNRGSKWPIIKLYQLAVEKFELVCKQRLVNNCQTIGREYTSSKFNQLISKLLTDELKSASIFSPIKQMFSPPSSSSATKKVLNKSRGGKVKSIENTLKNRQKLVNFPWGKGQIKFEQMMQRILDKIPEQSLEIKSTLSWDNSMSLRVNQIKKQCTQFMGKPLTKLFVRETIVLAKGAENRETFLDIISEQENSNCSEAMNLYVACEMIKLFNGPIQIVL